ncbi:hypothetical protein PBCV1_a268R [Paramecium bursaria Chlorella virus 1]|uniref:Uncharacterized protein n=1 Tax=Paramecium bursaria Chlorella virus 1 TaxID=10506 RepID=Q84585_PBCV1|nr:hypothetical protein PBCV1_a268R [Paramecium bursaria Chlorella virus 1]AAC96636.1 hypothetical protein [Paramecium bursaria Chlorella virus 1]
MAICTFSFDKLFPVISCKFERNSLFVGTFFINIKSWFNLVMKPNIGFVINVFSTNPIICFSDKSIRIRCSL